MAFQYQSGNLMRGAELEQRKQESFFDQIAKGLEAAQQAKALDIKRQELAMDAGDPEMLAQQGWMAVNSGGHPTAQQMAAMKLVDAQSRAKVSVDQYGNRVTNQSLFELLGGQTQNPPMGPQRPQPTPSGIFDMGQATPESVQAPAITNKAEEMAYQQRLDLEKEEKKNKLETDKKTSERKPLITSMRKSLNEMQSALDKTPNLQTGPVYGRVADLYNVPEFENLQGAQNTVALQARNLLELPASGFSDADRTFLEQVVGGKYQTRAGYQMAIDRIGRMLAEQENKLGIPSEGKTEKATQPKSSAKSKKERAIEILKQRGKIQ